MKNLGKFSSVLVIASALVLSGCSSSSNASEAPEDTKSSAVATPSVENGSAVAVTPNYDVENPLGQDMAQLELNSNMHPSAYERFTSEQIQDGARFGLNWLTQIVYTEDLYKEDRDMGVNDALILRNFIFDINPVYEQATLEEMKSIGANKFAPVPGDTGKILSVENDLDVRKDNLDTPYTYKNVPESIQWGTPWIEYRSTEDGTPLVAVHVKAEYPMVHEDGTEISAYVNYTIGSRINPNAPAGWDVNGWNWEFVGQND